MRSCLAVDTISAHSVWDPAWMANLAESTCDTHGKLKQFNDLRALAASRSVKVQRPA